MRYQEDFRMFVFLPFSGQFQVLFKKKIIYDRKADLTVICMNHLASQSPLL